MTVAPEAGDMTMDEAHGRPLRTRVRSFRLPAFMGSASPALTWIGVGIAMAGFALIAVGWGQVAGETEVYLQLPYVVSAGITGLGLVMVGVTVVNVAAKRRDAAERDRQMERLISVMEEITVALDARGPERAARTPRGGRR